MRRIGVGLLCLCVVPSFASAAACIWFADAESIKQVSTDTNAVVAEAPLAAPRRLVMNDTDCSVWALRNTNGRLRKFDAAGNEVRNVSVLALDPSLTEVLRIRLDPFDDTLWVTGERRIAHLDADAASVLASFTAPAEIRRFRIGMDQKLWVLGKRKLWRFNRQGDLLEERLLDSVLAGEARYFAVDELRETIWIAGEHQIAKMSSSAPGVAAVVAHVPEGTAGFALDPITGRLWFGRPGFIDALNPDGTPFGRVEIAGLGFTGLHKLRFDPASRSLWAGFSQQLARFTDAGELVATLAAVDYDDEAIGVPPFKVKPHLTLERPPEDGIVDRRRPVFELQYRARCNGLTCEVPQAYVSAFSLSATLNEAQVGEAFQFDAETGIASFRPENPLPQGPSSFTARLTDAFGHKSNRIDTSFTVDSIAPAFGPIKPPAGSVLTDPQVNLRGSINEPGSSVILENAEALNPQGANPQFPQPPDLRFSWGLTLRPGVNDLQLSAVDPAGNVASVTHTLTLGGSGGGGGPPQVAIQSPVSGAVVTDDQVTVSGTWSGPANTGITVNGVLAATNGNQFFATVPLSPGVNNIAVTATLADGTQVTSSVQVNSSGPSATRVSASVLQGLGPLQVNFTVVSDRPIQSVDGNYAVGYQICLEGCFEPGVFSAGPGEPLSFTYHEPRAYEAQFNIRHTDGTTVTKTLRIVVSGEDQVESVIQATWSGFAGALVAQNKTAALSHFASSAKARYTPVFDVLESSLPAIANELTTLRRSRLGDSAGEYFVTRQDATGKVKLFFIYFSRDADGVWRIESL